MHIILPIMLCCTAKKLPIMLKFMLKTYLLCSNYAQNLPIMLKLYPIIYASVPMHC